jgi:hypothetical protein
LQPAIWQDYFSKSKGSFRVGGIAQRQIASWPNTRAHKYWLIDQSHKISLVPKGPHTAEISAFVTCYNTYFLDFVAII